MKTEDRYILISLALIPAIFLFDINTVRGELAALLYLFPLLLSIQSKRKAVYFWAPLVLTVLSITGALLKPSDGVLLLTTVINRALAITSFWIFAFLGRRKNIADELLVLKEAELRTLAENLPDGVLRIDRTFTYRYANAAAEKIMESSREKILGRQVGLFGMPEEAQVVFRENIVRVGRTFKPAGMEFSLPRKERVYHYSVRFVPERGDSLKETILAIITDITGLKEAEAKLLEARDTAERRAAEAEGGRRILETMMEYIPEGIVIVDAVTERLQKVSAYIADFAGLKQRDLADISFKEYSDIFTLSSLNGTELPIERMPMWRALRRGEIVANEEYLLTRKNGEKAKVLINAVPIRKTDGSIIGALAAWRDITELEKAADQLRRNEYELRTLIDNSPDLVVRFDRFLRYVYTNPAYERITGLLKEQLAGKRNSELGMAKETEAVLDSALQKVVETGREASVELDLTSFFGKRYFWGRMIPEFARNGKVETVLLIARDITERKQAEEQIRYISFHDKVTGLYNRVYLEEEMRRIDSGRELPISILMGDVNNLKLTNDVFGHDEGDRLLKKIADILRISCRGGDIIARWGGDEFVVLLPRTECAAAGAVLGRISEECRKIGDMILQPSIALGVDTKTDHEESIFQTLRHAEECMYRNKAGNAQETQEQVVSALRREINGRRPETGEHMERVKGLIRAAGPAFNLSPDDVKKLMLVTDLHEMGRIRLPERIRSKREKLLPQEWAVMQQSHETSLRIAHSLSKYAPVFDILLSIHERWDGSGYPKGIKGGEIPYLGRVFVILDAYDVITHPRPYSPPMTGEEALGELKKEAGTRFDPVLIETFAARVATELPETVMR